MAERERLDVLLTRRGFFESRERARAAVMSGEVYAAGQKADKPGTAYPPGTVIEVRRKSIEYVSRGGVKLERALDCFSINVEGLSVLDGGASTGGFTDCLLRRGAARVWAVDVGYGQLAWRLRKDSRVTVIERFNIRNLTKKTLDGHSPGMAVLDLSFISLKMVLPVIREVLTDGGQAVCLVKPQFEAGRGSVGKHGVVRSPAVHRDVLQSFRLSAEESGFGIKDITFSPIKGPKGNIEFLAHLAAGAETAVDSEKEEIIVNKAHEELL